MKVIQYPEMGWLGRRFLCPHCGVLVEFELEDLKGISHFKPKLIDGQWSVIVQCPVDGKMQTFREVRHKRRSACRLFGVHPLPCRCHGPA